MTYRPYHDGAPPIEARIFNANLQQLCVYVASETEMNQLLTNFGATQNEGDGCQLHRRRDVFPNGYEYALPGIGGIVHRILRLRRCKGAGQS